MLTLTAEFEEVLTGLCARCPNGNNGNVYAFFEITNGVPNEREAPRKAVYVGSECASEKEIGRNERNGGKLSEIPKQSCRKYVQQWETMVAGLVLEEENWEKSRAAGDP